MTWGEIFWNIFSIGDRRAVGIHGLVSVSPRCFIVRLHGTTAKYANRYYDV